MERNGGAGIRTGSLTRTRPKAANPLRDLGDLRDLCVTCGVSGGTGV
jgi:hypothetical protein